ncbi:hypothetical protein IAQ61_000247 [Plenodomus lingam]|uniref:uncharacterized protein n=1 Tax=Leptosphaeria maculans TaxID=5022 RepID=UPI00333321AB|nr:hypothetical protein IAQ61_000247 [Plenodomus lingam]
MSAEHRVPRCYQGCCIDPVNRYHASARRKATDLETINDPGFVRPVQATKLELPGLSVHNRPRMFSDVANAGSVLLARIA